MKNLLPLGSVVLLKDSTKRVMITGRYQQQQGLDVIWDYSGCLYPEGNLDPEQSFLFNNSQIERVYFLGFQDEEEIAFIEFLAKQDPKFMEVDAS